MNNHTNRQERLDTTLNITIALVQEKMENFSNQLKKIEKNLDLKPAKSDQNLLNEDSEEEKIPDHESEQDLKENIMKMQQQKEFNDSENLKWMLYKLREYQLTKNLDNLNQEIPYGQKWQQPVSKFSDQEKRKLKE